MKTSTTYHNSFIITAIAAFLIFVAASCSRKINFASSSVVPAAQGSIKVKKDQNSNHAIEVNVSHLAEARKLTPPRNLYVVWIDTESNGIKNIGQLKSSTGLFSSTRKASLKTVTAFRPVRLFITAENDSDMRYPGSVEVLSTDYFRRY
jgi:hypothetical protein